MYSPFHLFKITLIKLPYFKMEIKTKQKASIQEIPTEWGGLAFQTLKDIFSIIKLVWFRHTLRPKLKKKKIH